LKKFFLPNIILQKENKKISKKCKKTIDKRDKKVYNTIENKAELSALTYLQGQSG
jgi:hypothetical protein